MAATTTKTEEQRLKEVFNAGEVVGTNLIIHTVFYTIIVGYEDSVGYTLTLLGQTVIRQSQVEWDELDIFINLHKRILNEQV